MTPLQPIAKLTGVGEAESAEVAEDRSDRRLHPRLRMINNGGATVNICRSEITTTVASADLPEDQEVAQAGAGRLLIQAQESAERLDPDLIPAGDELARRPHLEEVEKAENSFVNVFVEMQRDLEGRDSWQAESLDQERFGAVEESIRSTLAERGAPAATVIRRDNLLAATVPISELRELRSNPAISFVSPSEPLKLDVPVASNSPSPPVPQGVSTDGEPLGDSSAVLIGIIDVGGFDFAHPDFRDESGDATRFVSIWDQGGTFRAPPVKFGYGSEFTSTHLQSAIDAGESGGLPAVELEPQSQRVDGSHGTHVASIAAGRSGMCPDAAIAAVLIDVPIEGDEQERRRFTFSDTSRIAHAVDYLIGVAQFLDLPVAINISLGTNGGAHDGSSGVCRWLDQALAAPGRAICAAAGNSGQEAPTSAEDLGWISGRVHTSGRVAARGLEVEIEWVVVGNGVYDISENELEIWYSPQDRFVASVQPPGESRWYEAGPREFRENQRLDDGTTLSIYNELYHPHNGANYIAIYQSPNLDPNDIRGVRAGVWKVRLRGEEIRDGSFHAWIERDDPIEVGREAGRRLFRFPSFFTERSLVDSHTISSLACSRSVIAVANVDSARARVNVSSSQGPTRDGRSKPEIAAPGTDIVAAKGFSQDGSEWVSMTGTSMASPYVTGVVGLMMCANSRLTSAQCAGILQRTARPLPGASFEWQNDSGFGHIDAAAAISEAATFTQRTERT